MSENVVDVTVNDGTLTAQTNGKFAPIVAKVAGNVCSVYALAADGKPIASLIVRDKETGTETPVHVSTCAEAVVCSQGIPMENHLANLYGHSANAEAHLSAGEKAELETKAGAQAKATAAKNEAVSAASLMVESAKTSAANDATQKANSARTAAYNYTDTLVGGHTSNKSNPHNVTAAQVGLGNVPNKATNDLEPTYTVASNLAGLTSGEKLKVAFGKIAKAIADLIAHIGNKANPHGVTASQIGGLADYVIANGTSGVWSYWKFNSGLCIAMGNPTVTWGEQTKLIEGQYRSTASLDLTGIFTTVMGGTCSNVHRYVNCFVIPSGSTSAQLWATSAAVAGISLYTTNPAVVLFGRWK